MHTLKAKSKNTFDSNLLTHTKMVINLGLYIGSKAYDNVLQDRTWCKDVFLNKLGLALALHDIGKCVATTQAYYNNPTNKKIEEEFFSKPTHNVYSWAFAQAYLGLSNKINTPITKGILHHHVLNQIDMVSNITQNSLWKNLSEEERALFISFYNEIIDYLSNTHNLNYNIKPLVSEFQDMIVGEDKVYQIVDNPSYMQDVLLESVTSLIRACVVLADRTVSSICETQIHDPNFILNNNIEFFDVYYHNLMCVNSIQGIDLASRGYDMVRLQTQKDVLKVIDEHPHTVVSASAGFGKTLIGLMHFLEHKNKITWVVPRNVIASGTYRSIIKELEKIGETNVKVTLYCTGDVLESTHGITSDNLEESDIIVTNIDSILNRTVKNNMTRMLLQAYTSTVIFDEFHEFLCDKPLFPAFIRLMWARVYCTNSKTILLSATPMKLDCLGLCDRIYYHDKTPILNGDMKVNIKFKEIAKDEPFVIDDKDSFVITNTIPQAREIFAQVKDEDALLIHAHYTSSDRKEIESRIYFHHDKFAPINRRNTVVGTNIIGVGLDISAKNIYDFVLSPESTIQRGCGRGGRFNETEYNGEINYIVCTIKSRGTTRLINETFSLSLYDKWIEILKQYNGTTITKKELYDLYYKFYETNRSEVDKLYLDFFNKGNKDLLLIKPHKTKNKKDNNLKTICNDMSYRGLGDNLFVTAKDENDQWSDVILIPNYIIEKETQSHTDEMRSTIVQFIQSHPHFKYAMIANTKQNGIHKYKLLHRYGFDSSKKSNFVKENVKKLACRSDAPLPLFDFKYSKKEGLIPPIDMDEDIVDFS